MAVEIKGLEDMEVLTHKGYSIPRWDFVEPVHGEDEKFVMFWRSRPNPEGKLGEECLSPWFERKFESDGVTYSLVEQYIVAQKAMLFGDRVNLRKIRVNTDPKDIRIISMRIQGVDNAVWQEFSHSISCTGNFLKFSQHPDMKAYLLSTGDATLAEASPYDRTGGIGLDRLDEDATHPERWLGRNLFGYALMQVREKLRSLE
jgi:ribA/ribD-fused uncharacterized protein